MTTLPLKLKIHREFLRDLRFAIQSDVSAKAGHLDEAIAAGFGFKTRAALLTALENKDLRVCLDEPAFQAKMLAFGVPVSEGMFADIVRRRLDFSEDAPLYDEEDMKMGVMSLIRFPTEEELEDIGMEPHSFMAVFNENLVPGNNFKAKIKIIGDGYVEIGGWMMPIEPSTPWYSIK